MKVIGTYLLLFLLSTIKAYPQNTMKENLLKDLPPFSRLMLRQLYYVDEWTYIPQANEKRFILIEPNDEALKIYDNKELDGNPSFYYSGGKFYPHSQNILPNLKTGIISGECHSILSKKKKTKEWIDCTNTPCHHHVQKFEEKIELKNPYEYSWVQYKENKNISLCDYTVPFKFYAENIGSKYSSKSYLYLKPLNLSSTFASFDMNGITYFLDLRTFARGQTNGKYILDNWTQPLSYSDYENRWIEMKGKQKHDVDVSFFKKVKDCALKNDTKCLESNSFSKSEFFGDGNRVLASKSFHPIIWNKETIAELLACINPPKPHHFGISGLYIGNNKKCLFHKTASGFKIVTIDLPEAFVLGDKYDLKYEVFNPLQSQD